MSVQGPLVWTGMAAAGHGAKTADVVGAGEGDSEGAVPQAGDWWAGRLEAESLEDWELLVLQGEHPRRALNLKLQRFLRNVHWYAN